MLFISLETKRYTSYSDFYKDIKHILDHELFTKQGNLVVINPSKYHGSYGGILHNDALGHLRNTYDSTTLLAKPIFDSYFSIWWPFNNHKPINGLLQFGEDDIVIPQTLHACLQYKKSSKCCTFSNYYYKTKF